MPEVRGPDKHEMHDFSVAPFNVMLAHMKRTTLQLDGPLMAELRRRAAGEGRTLSEVIERTLRLGLSAAQEVRRARVALPSYDLGPFLVDPARPGRLPRPDEDA
jgi:hypothetical protein